MRRIVYVVFTLCSIGFTGSVLLVQYVNLLVGLLSFAFTFFCGAVTLEAIEIKFKDQEPAENTFIEKV